MTERTRTHASDASGPLHAIQIVARGMRAMALGLASHQAPQHSCRFQIALASRQKHESTRTKRVATTP